MPSISLVMPIGTIIHSMLSESQIQTYYGDSWVLCDGRSVSGSVYHTITGNSSLPNAMGRYLRAKDNAAGVDPNGDAALGTLRADQNKSHVHEALVKQGAIAGNDAPPMACQGGVGTDASFTYVGAATNSGADVQPLSVVVNVFIKIN